jgi:very-short-patch-repair endonuclease
MRDRKPRNLASNVLWAGFLALLGFLHPMFFIGSAFVAWLAWQELKNPDDGRQPVGPGRRPMVASNEPHWEEGFVAVCDSPAEEAFVRGAIRHFGMQPCMGLLRGGGLKLQLQVQIGRFRVDFLANEWLVIEVDGAAWHSSEEALKRDGERDAELNDDGYGILRLPAKLVFNQPGEAMRRLEAALSEGRPSRPERAKPEVNFGNAIDGFFKVIEGANEYARRQREIEQALRPARDVVATERMLLDGALESARIEIDIQSYRAKSDEHARAFDEAYARLEAALDAHRNSEQADCPSITLMPLVRPGRHVDPETHRTVQALYEQMLADRETFIADVRQKATADARVTVHAREYLAKLDCERLWDDVIGADTKCQADLLQLQALADEWASVEPLLRAGKAASGPKAFAVKRESQIPMRKSFKLPRDSSTGQEPR